MKIEDIKKLFNEENGYNWSMPNSIMCNIFDGDKNNHSGIWTRDIKYSWRKNIRTQDFSLVRVFSGGKTMVVFDFDVYGDWTNFPYSILMSEIL